jgi:isopenicillin N synthase-like dioxygenase
MNSEPNKSLPPFPGGIAVDAEPLATIDLGRLLVKDADEIQKLSSACITHGFFYLDLQTSELGRNVLEGEQGVLRFMEKYFSQSHETKMLEDRQSFLHG